MPISIIDKVLGVYGDYTPVDPSIKSGRQFITSDTILIGARKTDYDIKYDSLDQFTAIGIVQSATVAQRKNIESLYEIGSEQLYLIPGRTSIGANLGRIAFDGQSLLRALYGEGEEEISIEDSGFNTANGQFMINLASEFLNNPIDLLFALFDKQSIPIGAFYLQSAYCTQHQMTLSTQNVVVLENVELIAARIVSLGIT